MNSLDDFATARPAVDPLSPERLDQLWDAVVDAGPIHDVGAEAHATVRFPGEGAGLDLVEDRDPIVGGSTRRRIAVLGAAAALLCGVIGAAVVAAGRSDTSDPVNGRPTVSSSVDTLAPGDEALIDPSPTVPLSSAEVLGPSPEWRVNAPGWSGPTATLNGPGDQVVPDGVRFFVDPDSPEEAWVFVYPSGETAVVPATDPPLGAPPALSTTQTVERDGEFFGVIAGGIGDPRAGEIVAAAQTGAPIPFGFVEVDPAELGGVWNLRRIEFDGPDGMRIEVEIEGGGLPGYNITTSSFTVEPAPAKPGVDEAVVQSIGDDLSVVARTGFWVSRVLVTGNETMTFEELVALVQLDGTELDR